MQARRIARELALLSASQLPNKLDQLEASQLQDILVAAVRTLTAEVREALEVAVSELERGSERLLSSETRAADLISCRSMTREAIDLTQAAINRLGIALELPEFIQLANQKEVRSYALQILGQLKNHRDDVDAILNTAMVDWQLDRVVRLDRDILRIAVIEIQYLGIPDRVAISEAIELAKRYGDEDSYRFINGVLRRVNNYLSGGGDPTST
jgi:N utilization substance protein B